MDRAAVAAADVDRVKPFVDESLGIPPPAQSTAGPARTPGALVMGAGGPVDIGVGSAGSGAAGAAAGSESSPIAPAIEVPGEDTFFVYPIMRAVQMQVPLLDFPPVRRRE